MFGKKELSTVQESESEHAPPRLLRTKKSKLLARFKDVDGDEEQWEQIEPVDFKQRLSERKEHRDTFVSRSQSTQSISSGFSSVSAESSQFVESDTEHSDYADDFDDLEPDLNLAQKLELRRQQAEKLAELTRRTSRLYLDEADEPDNGTFHRLKVVSPKKLRAKSSMPVLAGNTGRKSIRKSSSSMDIPKSGFSRSLHRTMSSMNIVPQPRTLRYSSDLDDIDAFPEDLTITLSDYKKLKRKSRALDLSMYAEQDTRPRRPQYADPTVTNSTRLTKEGKLKMIRSMGRNRGQHTMGGMVYDPEKMKWRGNEQDLSLFEMSTSTRPSSMKSSLQRSKSSKNLQVVGNMVYDTDQLRWVSMTGKYEDDPFDNFDDTITEMPKRGKPARAAPKSTHAEHFQISDGMYKAWKVENERWGRKVGSWFPADNEGFAYCYELKTILNEN
ncbi:hypothetical protein OGAPHI_002506 [Ogataea philodendri]|uniref:Uncharacterized protein n=1 Tax=Ogataea philodendri TaxID=1378263 RepID=A0A9P8T889_9ASCO|nr:uncharacterized protein OGAPHI_002506 [Ogataea philodendri]KAH3668751.1 hypothetical protein OGAPHI_002506 [Ogataea philodendri]